MARRRAGSKRYKGPLEPKKWHFYAFFIWLCGFIFPPFGAAVRFGIGKDFFITLVLTLCGWIPGQIYNFYIQNIRNNKNASRTPKWAIRYKLVDTEEFDRRARKRQWKHRYEERNAHSTWDDDPSRSWDPSDPSRISGAAASTDSLPATSRPAAPRSGDSFVTEYYNPDPTPEPQRYDDPVPRKKGGFFGLGSGGGGAKKADRWERSRRAREEDEGQWERRNNRGYHAESVSEDGTNEGPEDAVGGRYGRSSTAAAGNGPAKRTGEEEWHQF